MKSKNIKLAILLSFFLFSISTLANAALVKGIYLTQTTLEDTPKLNYLISKAKQVGIDTFIVDMELPSKKYEHNIALLKENNINYVARITMFPDGATPAQINDSVYWQRKYKLVKQALAYGASQIQLDYIRYNTRSGSSHEHAINVHKIIRWYKDKLEAQNIPLQIDVFGISAFGEETHIGQNIKLFAQTIDTVCPMVYPSHYRPFDEHMKTPYETVYGSLKLIKEQFDNKMPIKLIPYLELSNYHYPLSREKKLKYIYAQIHAAENAGVDGWYIWSPNNEYDNLFRVLQTYDVK